MIVIDSRVVLVDILELYELGMDKLFPRVGTTYLFE